MSSISSRFQNEMRMPFVGFQGVGSRLELVTRSSAWILRETLRSQVFTLLILAVIGFTPLWLLTFRIEKVKGGLPAYGVLALAGITGVGFGAKYLLRLINQRRVEFDLASQTVRLITNGTTSERSFPIANVQSFTCSASTYTYSKGSVPNFSLVLLLDDGDEINLGISDNEANVKSIFEKLSQILPGAHGSH